MAMDCDEILDDFDTSRRLAAYWKSQVTSVDEANSRWHKRGAKIVKRYKDERDQAAEEGNRRLNMLWSNVQILQPAIYGRRPQPIAERRFLDPDPVGRLSAQMMERALRNEIEDNGYHAAIKRAVQDYLLPGRGQVWVRYEPEIGPGLSLTPSSPLDMRDAQGEIVEDEDKEGEEDDKTEKLEETGEQILSESCPIDYVQWRDFYMFPVRARTWTEVTAIGKKIYLSKSECIERFGETVGKEVQADASISVAERQENLSITTLHDQNERKRIVYEIWNKADRRVYWVSTGYDYLCDLADDPLELKGFFPCPEPLSATMTNDSLIPVPDYIEYQDQALQIDELTQRIALLTKACKVAGVYDAANRPLKRLLDESVENELIPVDDWVRYGDKGGVAGAISFLPLKEVMETIDVLMSVKEKMLQDLDRVTGISDVLRGTTDGRETMGGTRLKTNNAGTRIDERRNEVARFARDVIRLIAEVIGKHFSAKSIIEISGVLHEEEFSPIQKVQELISEMASQGGGMGGEAAGPPSPQPALPPPGAAPGSPPSPIAPPQPPAGAPSPGPAPMGGPAVGAGGPAAPSPPQQPQQPTQPSPLAAIMELQAPIEALLSRLGKALSLLRSDIPGGYRIDIEVDSTISGDAQEERADSVEFLGAVTKFIETAGMIGAQQPAMIPLLGKMLQFGVRKFRTGRDLESAIDDFCDQAEKKAKALAANPQAKGPSPEELKMQADMARHQAEIARSQLESQAAAENDKRDREKMAMEHQARLQQMQLQMEQQREEHQMRLQEIQAAKIAKEIAHHQDVQRASDPTSQNIEVIKAHSTAAKAQAEISKAQLESHTAEKTHQLDRERAQAEHENRMHEMQMARELKMAEHQAKLTHLHHERLGAHEDHMFKIDHLDHQRAMLREKAAADRRATKSAVS